MTFEPDDWLDDDSDALDNTCSVETGSVHNPTTIPGFSCFIVPPREDRQQEHTKIFIKDTSEQININARVTIDGQTYIVQNWERDGVYMVGEMPQWNESL